MSLDKWHLSVLIKLLSLNLNVGNHFNNLFLAESEFQIQMLAGNKLKICVGAGFEISSTLLFQ